MPDVPAPGDDHYESVCRFLRAFDAGAPADAANQFATDAAVFEVDHDGFGHMSSAIACARGRSEIARWLGQFTDAGVRIHPTGRRDGPGWMEVEAEWRMVGPGGETVTSHTRGRYTFEALEIRYLVVISEITA